MHDLNHRQRKILQYILFDDNYIPARNISNILGVSIKTIYRDLTKIEQLLNKYNVQLSKRRGKGIRLVLDEEKRNIISFELAKKRSTDEYVTNPRWKEILLYLLWIAPKSTSIHKLSSIFFVGGTSIVNDLNTIEKNLKDTSLRLHKSFKGTSIVGREYDIRCKINELITKQDMYYASGEVKYDTRLDEENFNQLSNYFSKELLICVENILENIENGLGYEIGYVYFINIITHVLIAIKRINDNRYIGLDHIRIDSVNLHIYRLIIEAFQELEQQFQISLPDAEIKYIYLHVTSAGRDTIKKTADPGYKHRKNNSTKEMLFRDLTREMSRALNVNLMSNEQLKNSLAVHISSMINRIRYNIRITCPLLKDTREEFPKLFDLTKDITLKVFKKYYPDLTINDDEICYIVLYVQAFLEQHNKNYKVVLVCNTGVGTSYLLKGRVQNKFPNWDVVDVLSVTQLKNYDFSKVDLIISTTRIENFIPNNKTPVAYVSALLDKNDIATITDIFDKLNKERNGLYG